MLLWQELQNSLIALMAQFGLIHFRSGKTRDIFHLPNFPDMLLIVASDRISIFDIVLNAIVPFKGEVLNAITVLWTKLLKDVIQTHVVAYGSAIDEYLPRGLRGNVDLHKRAIVVHKKDVFLYEAIVRGWLTGSGWLSYQESGTVCGIVLPPGLHDGSRLAEPIFTPSTKAELGEHDENIPADQMKVSEADRLFIEHTSLKIFNFMNAHANPRGLIIADSKFEMARGMLLDEYGTPDSSRIWLYTAWEEADARGEAPEGFDKEFFRKWGKMVGIKQNPHLIPPLEVISKTTDLYLQAASLLCDKSLAQFQVEDMRIAA